MQLALVAPFQLASEVVELVVFDLGALGAAGAEEVFALGAVTGLRLWLVLDEPPGSDLGDLLRAHCPTWCSLDDAEQSWRHTEQLSLMPTEAARVARSVVLNQMTSEEARLSVFARTRQMPPTRTEGRR